MEPVDFDEAETYEPEEGWARRALAGSDRLTFEWFEKPSGHSSPMHDHENEGDERAVGLDVFAPGRSFDFWTDQE